MGGNTYGERLLACADLERGSPRGAAGAAHSPAAAPALRALFRGVKVHKRLSSCVDFFKRSVASAVSGGGRRGVARGGSGLGALVQAPVDASL